MIFQGSVRGQNALFAKHRTHPGEVRRAARVEIALNQAAFAAAPAFHPNRPSAPFHRIDGGGAKLRAQGGERPSLRIEHAHTALAVDHDGETAAIAISFHRNVQDVFGLPQECSHEKLIGRRRGSLGKICYN